MDPVVLFERAASDAASMVEQCAPGAALQADTVHGVGCGRAGHAHGRRHRVPPRGPRYRVGRGPCRRWRTIARRWRSVWMRCMRRVRWSVGACHRLGSSGRSPRRRRAPRWTSWSTLGTWPSQSVLTVSSIPIWSTRSSRCFCHRCPRSAAQAGIVGPEVAVGDDASPQDRLLGAMGRRPVIGASRSTRQSARWDIPVGARCCAVARDEERTASELAAVADLSPSAASPHLKLLRETGLMHVRIDAKRRLYRVDLQRLGAGASCPGRALG